LAGSSLDLRWPCRAPFTLIPYVKLLQRTPDVKGVSTSQNAVIGGVDPGKPMLFYILLGTIRYENRDMRDMNLDEYQEKQAVKKQKEMMKDGIKSENAISGENDGVDAAKPKLRARAESCNQPSVRLKSRK
jgi:hypothetical protein